MLFALGVTTVAPAVAQDKNPPGLNPEHFQCYDIVEAKASPKRQVQLQDQFGETRTVTAKAVLLCNPVSKNGEEIHDKRTHLVCYQMRPGKPVGKRVEVQNQFGTEPISVKSSRILCVPSLKRVPG
jgi:hypothetical protein